MDQQQLVPDVVLLTSWIFWLFSSDGLNASSDLLVTLWPSIPSSWESSVSDNSSQYRPHTAHPRHQLWNISCPPPWTSSPLSVFRFRNYLWESLSLSWMKVMREWGRCYIKILWRISLFSHVQPRVSASYWNVQLFILSLNSISLEMNVIFIKT